MSRPTLPLHELVRSPWCILPEVGRQLFPLAMEYARGGMLSREQYAAFGPAPATQDEGELQDYYISPDGRVHSEWKRPEELPDRLVHVRNVMGVLSKRGSSATWGHREIAQIMQREDKKEKVMAHVMVFDTPGGSAAGLATSAEMIGQLEKPVIGFVDGMAASAGMWILSPCNERYCIDEESLVGSIGTYIAWADLRGKLEKEGGTVHEYYATKSTRKNEPFRKAEGTLGGKKDPSLIYSEILDPHNEAFHAAIMKNIPGISDQPQEVQDAIFSGAVFTAPEALSYGLIDGIASFESVIERAFELGRDRITILKV